MLFPKNIIIVLKNLNKCGFFPDFQYGLQFSRSFSDLLVIESDRVPSVFKRSLATQTKSRDASKAFYMIWLPVLFNRIGFRRISGCINDLPDDVECNIAIYADTTFHFKCDQAHDVCQQLRFASKLQSDLRYTLNLG